MKSAGVKLDLENDTALIYGNKVNLDLTSSGHYCVPIDRNGVIPVHEICSVQLENNSPKERYNILLKLHRQFAHPPMKRLITLLKDAGVWKEDYTEILQGISNNCQICKFYSKTPPRPSVAMPMSTDFNEMVTMDLKLWRGQWILHIIDMWSRFTISVFIPRKRPCDVIDGMMKYWVCVFGLMGGILKDNGGEFSSEEMREITSILNVRVHTTAGESPFQNGLCERVHAITDGMLNKLEAENEDKNLNKQTLLSWANMARNSLQMISGYSSYQLVMGRNPRIPCLMDEKPPALHSSTTSKVFADHLNALHETRKAYIQSESSERIRRALRTKMRVLEQTFNPGDLVYYKREKSERWLGPGKIIFQDGKVVFVRHGGVYVRVSPNRLLKVEEKWEEKQTDLPDKENQQSEEKEESNKEDQQNEEKEESNNLKSSEPKQLTEILPKPTSTKNPDIFRQVANARDKEISLRANDKIKYQMDGEWKDRLALPGRIRPHFREMDREQTIRKVIFPTSLSPVFHTVLGAAILLVSSSLIFMKFEVDNDYGVTVHNLEM
ncbi:hypothetical protein SNE40_002919 [Patella caerulea]|uniref:Integrase catalytic domain-containing protein n=1 Tax=Patella caerulea TaxID=87958 RepID=A0AAN8QEM4_PATCE